MEDIILVDKPKGITSFDVIRRLRSELGVRKIGHAGTLDPLATGLMIIGVGVGTKKLSEYIKLPKEYVAEVRIGERRTTGDLEGDITEECVVPELKKSFIEETLHSMVGELTLPVSVYSAIKKGGVPMYKRARKAEREGKSIDDVPLRTMLVTGAELVDATSMSGKCIITVRFSVGSGTYIRSLGEELGRRLGNYPATLQNLRRTKIGDFNIEDARTVV